MANKEYIMHSFHGDNVVIHHNSDYSGEVIICQDDKEIRMNAGDLIDFVAEYVRREKIKKLETSDSKTILFE
jgi:hypothetical protein